MGKALCQKEIPREQVEKILTQGKTDLYYGPGPGGKYITHVPQLTFQPHDVKLVPEETITDSAGRPVFVISRLAADEGK